MKQRHPKYVDRVALYLKKIKEIYPDLRIGQIIDCALSPMEANTFYVEDDVLAQHLEELYERYSTERKTRDH
jgi:muramidase (phage lysozyme)